ncbi:MAG: Ig-like domain-containing protein, partial [Gemmatimonadaceae bacterium]
MHKVSRSLLLAGVLAFGTLTAACGDKVELTQVNPNTGVTLITVTPTSASVAAGSTLQLAVSVVADANTAKTVTWSTSSAAVATVDATGKVTGVAAGTATIIATSTVDNSKAAAAVITVTAAGGNQNTPNTVAISTITQGGTLFPANLANVAGQVDVTLFVSGPGGTLNLIQNCTANGATSTTGDVIVAQQVIAGSQNQSPVTLSYNTAATGTVTSGLAVVNANSSTPIALNGNCVLKAQLGTAIATNITPFTLNNANIFRSATTFTKTTTLGTQNAISAANGLRYDQGDLKVDVTPVVYTTVAPGGAAQTPALATISYAGRVFTNVAFTGGKFSVTFPSTGATAQNIAQYTSPAAGDQVIVSGYSDAVGSQITIGNPIAANTLRSDNQSPTVNAGALAQVLNLTGAPRNYINAAYAFLANNTAQTDAAFAASQMTVSFYVGAVPAGAVYPTAQSVSFSGAACSTSGLTKVAAGADIAQTAAPFTPGYFVRVVENDPLGNAVCQDFGPFGVDKQNPNDLQVTGGAANNSVITAASTTTFFSVDSVSGFTPGAALRVRALRNFTNTSSNCVYGGFASSNCPTVASDFNVDPTGAFTTEAYYQLQVFAQDQAGNVSPTLTRVYLIDTTIPTVGGISIPQTLVGGQSVTFTSQANDNVDLQSSSFDIM